MRAITGIVLAFGLTIAGGNAFAQQPTKTPPVKPVAKPAAKATPPAPIAEEPIAAEAANWRGVATEADRKRIRNWWKSWDEALKSAKANGFTKKVAGEGVLLKPDAALPNPYIPPGDYKCRVIKLGSPDKAAAAGTALAYIDYPFFKCRIAAEQAIFSLTKLTGSQRPVGLLFDDTEKRQIFLGTMVLGDETSPMDYATDSKRDMAGLLERIGPRRWRLVLPAPAYESLLDVFEIIPETP
jgi:Domain of unknown function (DUF4893)